MKIYIENSRFLELVSELATQITEMNYGADTWDTDKGLRGITLKFNEEAQEYFNEMYSEYEALLNNIANIYSDGEQ